MEIEENVLDDIEISALTQIGHRLIDTILRRAAFEDIQTLVTEGAPVWFQDEEEGISPLHAAAYTQQQDVVKFLIDAGAPWNAVDNNRITAADIALSLNDEQIYNLIRDAGIRAELLLTLLSTNSDSSPPVSSLVIRDADTTAAGSTAAFLSTPLRFTTDTDGQDMCVIDLKDEEVGVMMGWELPIMQKTVQNLFRGLENQGGLKILNVGFGLGIIDNLFQSLSTTTTLHVIIEPHRDILQHMRELGWYDRPGVKILEGRWQDFVNSPELLGLGGFDVIFTDTFSENYQALHQFFQTLPKLLAKPSSRFSFFNGLGATDALFYDVYTHLSELHLNHVGLEVVWDDVDVSEEKQGRWGQTRNSSPCSRRRTVSFLVLAKKRLVGEVLDSVHAALPMRQSGTLRANTSRFTISQ